MNDEAAPIDGWLVTSCEKCYEEAFWYKEQLRHPPGSIAPLPNPDLPTDVRETFEEARQIAAASPRGAAALLRLCVQMLCIELGYGNKLNDAIGQMVKAGLDEAIQESLDVVRVVGNDAVHPGVIDPNDGNTEVTELFALVNDVAEDLISRPARRKGAYNRLPERHREWIDKRNDRMRPRANET